MALVSDASGKVGAHASVSATELGYLDGVTSAIQTQLNGKQPLDAGLTALATGGSGIVAQDGNTIAWRTLTAPAAGITVTNGNGVGGNPTLALANGLASIETLATTGFVVQSGTDTFITRDIATAAADRIVVTNGSGVTASPTIDLATVADSASGSFVKVSRDTYGRVTGTAPVTSLDITGLVDSTYVNASGDSMTGLHKLLMSNCEEINISSYCDRPVQIFKNAHKKLSIISFKKTGSPIQKLNMTKMYRLQNEAQLPGLMERLSFVNVLESQLMPGRLPKVSYPIEIQILNKIFNNQNTNIKSIIQESKGSPVYYRSAGGMYFNVITNYANGLSSEKKNRCKTGNGESDGGYFK
jgi:hypothetical protein